MITDSDWFKKHKEEIENIRLIMENLKKDKKIQKLYEKFKKSKIEKR